MKVGIIAYVDKTVVKIKGLQVTGLKPYELENKIEEILGSRVRIIGVTGSSIDMDIYGISEEQVYKNEKGIIEAISITQGITAEDVIKISSANRIVDVDYKDIPSEDKFACPRERWLNLE